MGGLPDKCLGFKGYVRDWDGKDLFEQSIVTPAEKLRRQQESEKEHQQYLQEERQKQAQCDKKFGRKCQIELGNSRVRVTDGEGYLLNKEMYFIMLDHYFEYDDKVRETMCAIPLRPGVEYDEGILWRLRRFCGKTNNQESSSKPTNQKPAPSVPPPQQTTKLDILKKNSQFIFECIVVTQIFAISAEEKNADADLKKITKSLSDRYSGYGDQMLTVTDELKSRAERMTLQFSALDKDTQVGRWQRCNQWQP